MTRMRLFLAGAVAFAFVVGMAAATPAAADAAQPGFASNPADKIQPELREAFAAGESSFWVRFVDRADLSQARQIDDWVARGEAVAAALRSTARTSQAPLRAALDSQRVDYQPFWATNAILIHSGQPALAQQIASRPEVQGLYAPVAYDLVRPTPGTAEREINALEWGIANINADDVWGQFGARGEGITVASIDTGVQFDHPALVRQYRGNLGDGTFDHDYNWFDAAGTCAGRPCDGDGHGTHTMGTMVGDDGAENQIGVAPEANWITANGCCPSDGALIASGEWMLEPTDLAGDNPDASKRPHVINNSWGSELPSTDPFMEDVIEAWDASGILGIWANGNSGELGCNSSGSPGSRTLAYSVGAYDIDNDIASFSGRGPGQDGQLKPNISAPGVNVRSSVPGGGYGLNQGTSMAAPHVAGAVALLWSAAPALVSDNDATIALLDSSAVDTEDLQCGGTAEDNNVYGEGRLDALALLQEAPIGDVGTLTGTVTDAATGEPVAGATVAVTGPHERELATDADGSYLALLPVGDYTVTASAFGYTGQTAEASIMVDETTTADFALAAVARVTISGLVRDGSGHGWPVYAKLSLQDTPGVSTYTNPFTGRYRLSVPVNASYTLLVEPQYEGYREVTQTVQVQARNLVQDVEIPIVAESCTAPGYAFAPDVLSETFESGALPAGWTVVDNIGNDQVWRFDNPRNRTNLTGGGGGFAIVDSDAFGSGNSQDTELVSPTMDLSAVDEPVIRFNQDFDWWSGGQNEIADLDVSVDDGVTWENVLRQSGGDVRGPRRESIAIPQAGGEPDVRIRFHYGPATFEFWWQVDNVQVGSCQPLDGGLVAGLVRDRNTTEGINGATVTSGTVSTESFATPDDPAQPDGFYWLFSPLTGTRSFTGSAGNYTSQTVQVDVEADWTTRRNFSLAAGQLTVTPAAVQAEVPLGATRQRTVTITNDGTAAVEVELTERDGDFVILRADGSRVSSEEILASPGAAVHRVPVGAPLAQLSGAYRAAGRGVAGTSPSQVPHEAPWTDLPNYPSTVFDNSVAVVDGNLYSIGGIINGADSREVWVFDPAAQTWTRLDDIPGAGRSQAVEGAIDGRIYLVSGWSDLDTTTLIYDPATGEWTNGAGAPAGRAAAGSAVLDGQLYMVGGCTTGDCEPYADEVFRYDPATDTWETLANYPVPTSWLSCGAVTGELFCAGGLTSAGATDATYRYDPGTDTWTQVADMPFDLWGGGYVGANDRFLIASGFTEDSTVLTNEGFSYDPGSDTWEALPAANNALFRSGSGCGLYKVGGASFNPLFGFIPDDAVEVLPGFDVCGAAADVPWLSVTPTTATLAPGDSLVVTVRLSADVAQPGTYTAGIRIGEDTPYAVAPVDVTMNVTPPSTWGKITGTVTAVDCAGGESPLPDATVHLSTWVMELTLFSDEDGEYARWLDWRHSPITMIVAKDGYQPQVRQTEIVAGEVTVEDWTLRRVCTRGTVGAPM